MSDSLDNYTDEQLNIGKILLLRKGIYLASAEIKKEVKAKKVIKLNLTKQTPSEMYGLVVNLIYQALLLMGVHDSNNINICFVTGDDANTSMMRLKRNNVYASIEVDAQSLKQLRRAIIAMEQLGKTMSSMANSIRLHNQLSELLTKQKLPNSILKKTKTLTKIAQGYGDAELQKAVDTINNFMKSTW